MAYVFDGPNKIITFDVSTTELDVRDLWSRYIDWLATSDNGKYLEAMRVVGGDPLPGSKALGITYFMLNGWKIKPYEENHSLIINGNLYSEDGSSPYTNVIGNYQVMLINSVSSLVDSTVQQLPEIEHGSFNNVITLDVNKGYAGTAYPIGTPMKPVNNLEDAKLIATYRGFKHIHLNSNLTITTGQNIDELHLISDNWLEVIIEPGVSTQNTNFERLSLWGELDGFWNVLIDCWVYDITNFCGWLRKGSFVEIALAPFTEESQGQSYFDDIVPMFPDEPSILKMNTNTNVAFSNVTGLFQINDMTAGSILGIGLARGEVTIDNSCTGGSIRVMGIGEVINNSIINVEQDALLCRDDIGHAVWEIQMATHQTSGSAGKALSNAGNAGDPWSGELPGTYVTGQAGFILDQISTLINELHKIQGLDINNPMTITRNVRTAGDIELKIDGDGETLSIISRQ